MCGRLKLFFVLTVISISNTINRTWSTEKNYAKVKTEYVCECVLCCAACAMTLQHGIILQDCCKTQAHRTTGRKPTDQCLAERLNFRRYVKRYLPSAKTKTKKAVGKTKRSGKGKHYCTAVVRLHEVRESRRLDTNAAASRQNRVASAFVQKGQPKREKNCSRRRR